MFYLTYRPRTVNEIDNSKVKDIFTHILDPKKEPQHALLFIGQKGTGKTSMARIIAKSVNCLKNAFSNEGASAEPCNNCANCIAIENSSSPDVIELDAASNRGIDDIKNLIKETGFLPMTGNYRVFIIDEAHMITNEGFNALLKTLEEPPKKVIFILATTNVEKIPSTIRSRCTLINFGKARKGDIVHMLNRIIDRENLKLDPHLIPLIAEYSDNSFRDAAKLLEELILQNKLTMAEGEAFLGTARQDFLKLLKESDIKTALSWIYEFNQNGGNIRVLLEQTLNNLRLGLLKSKGVSIEEETETYFETADTIRLMKLFTDAYSSLRSSPIESLPLEIAVTEFYNEKMKKGKGVVSN